MNYEILHLRISPHIPPNWRDMWDWVQHKGESRQVSRQIGGIQDPHDLIEKMGKPNLLVFSANCDKEGLFFQIFPKMTI